MVRCAGVLEELEHVFACACASPAAWTDESNEPGRNRGSVAHGCSRHRTPPQPEQTPPPLHLSHRCLDGTSGIGGGSCGRRQLCCVQETRLCAKQQSSDGTTRPDVARHARCSISMARETYHGKHQAHAFLISTSSESLRKWRNSSGQEQIGDRGLKTTAAPFVRT
jgi:hypothetical protein